MDEFIGHWEDCNTALAPGALVVRLMDNTTLSRAQFEALRNSLQTQQTVVQGRLAAQQVARGSVQMKKSALLAQFNLFTGILDADFQNTEFADSRPLAPTMNSGQAAFTEPLVDMMSLWEEINGGPAPAGVTLPLVLPDGTTHGAFASAVSALQFAYADERKKGVKVSVSRSKRDRMQVKAYEAMRLYREAVPPKLVNFPELIDSLPRLTPLPGHTPQAVNASSIFQEPDQSKTVYDASTDPMLASYQLRGNVGDEYSDEDAVVIATNAPGAPREFVTPFGLNQPGARIALKVFVVLTTGNEAGSAAMFVQRPLALAA
jgi:hypothetical protein